MIKSFRTGLQISCLIAILATMLSVTLFAEAFAITPLPTPDPQPGSIGLEATKKKAPPTQGATITTPGSGGSYAETPITVNGICPNGLLVEIYNNGVMVGSTMCNNGSFSVSISLFIGANEISAVVYDELGQAGPVSNIVTVSFNDSRLTAFGQLVTLTSSYGRRSAAATTQLTWPLQLSGGSGPYAFSIDWGDGSKPELKSQAFNGLVDIAHIYKNAGIYTVNITVADANGVTAFLQVVAVSNGKVDSSTAASGTKEEQTTSRTTVMWIPAAASLALMLPTFWLGRRSQMISIRNKMLKERDAYKAE